MSTEGEIKLYEVEEKEMGVGLERCEEPGRESSET